MSATKDCLRERPHDRFYESRSPFFFSILVAVRSYIDLSHTFDLQASEEDHAILQSIPLLFPIDSILRSPACYLDELSAQALNSSIKVGQSLWLRPFEMRLKFWKGLIDRAYDGGDSDYDALMNSLTSSFESDQALEALQYLETYVKNHLGTLVERCKTISIPEENESDRGLLWHFFQHSLQTLSVRHGTSLMYSNSLSRQHGHHRLVLLGPFAPVLIGFHFGKKLLWKMY
ncbi:hypothetical protein DFJ73DRAFT_856611 [Zopfochytrium polystomum]|nr:hypothetical protein DFJ73DRAFT_856611 [Zopfochytrium polystomum]